MGGGGGDGVADNDDVGGDGAAPHGGPLGPAWGSLGASIGRLEVLLGRWSSRTPLGALWGASSIVVVVFPCGRQLKEEEFDERED